MIIPYNVIMTLGLVMNMNCPDTKIVNKTEEWTERDQITLDNAKNRCESLYENSPCLKYFEKYDFQAYRATCGAAETEKKAKRKKK